jgi:hypothetical protein
MKFEEADVRVLPVNAAAASLYLGDLLPLERSHSVKWRVEGILTSGFIAVGKLGDVKALLSWNTQSIMRQHYPEGV